MSSHNIFFEDLQNQKRSVVLSQNGEKNRILKYVGGDNILYRNIFIQNQYSKGYYGHIYQQDQSLNMISNTIQMSGNLNVLGSTTFSKDLQINGNLVLNGSFLGNTSISVQVVGEDLFITGNATFSSNISTQTLKCAGNATFNGINTTTFLLNGMPLRTNTTTSFTESVSVSGNLTVSNNALLRSGLVVSGNATFNGINTTTFLLNGVPLGNNTTTSFTESVSVSGNLTVSNNALLRSGLIVSGNATFNGINTTTFLLNGVPLSTNTTTSFTENVSVSGNLIVSNNALLRSGLIVSGNATFNGINTTTFLLNGVPLNNNTTTSFTESVSVSGNLTVSSNALLRSGLIVSGNATFNGINTTTFLLNGVPLNNNTTTSFTESVSVSGDITISGDTNLLSGLVVSGNATFNALNASSYLLNGVPLGTNTTTSFTESVSVSGDITISGDTNLLSGLVVSGNATFNAVNASSYLLNGLPLETNTITNFTESVSVSGVLTISGDTNLLSGLIVNGDATFNTVNASSYLLNGLPLSTNTITSFTESVSVSGVLTISGDTNLLSGLVVSGNATFNTVNASSYLLNGLPLSTNTITSFTESVSISGDITISGESNLFSNLNVNGKLTVNNNTDIYGNLIVKNDLTATYNYIGHYTEFLVPQNIYQLNVELYGSAGMGNGSVSGGNGGFASGTLKNVHPGDILYLFVGGQSRWNGGGQGFFSLGNGGDATDIRINGTGYNDRIIVAGGGGGASINSGITGFAGGGLEGNGGDGAPDLNGEGGKQDRGGIGGNNAQSGTLGNGGNGAQGGGGGGGGYFGGGGGGFVGGSPNRGLGGGGSSYADPNYIINFNTEIGVNEGLGYIVINLIYNNHGCLIMNPVKIGSNVGSTNQSSNAIAIGYEAGNDSQASYAIAIGYQAGKASQGANSIAIGNFIGIATPQASQSIAFNASTNSLDTAIQAGFYVNPIRNDTNVGLQILNYNSLNKEITYKSLSYAQLSNTNTITITPLTTITMYHNVLEIASSNSFTGNYTDPSDGRITFLNSGVYKIGASILYHAGSGSGSSVSFWFKKNGENIPNSGSIAFVPGNGKDTLAYAEIITNMSANQTIAIYSYTEDNNITSRTTAANGDVPSCPAIITTITQLS